MKVITKTSHDAMMERRALNRDSKCPQCGRISRCSTIASKAVGFFNVKTVERKSYTCIRCGCQWNTGWK